MTSDDTGRDALKRQTMIYILYATIGLAPSIIWLLFYLRKDRHPEPNNMVIKIFLWGVIIGPIAAFLELFFKWSIQPTAITNFIASLGNRDNYHLISVILIAPIVEEFLKYFVIRYRVLKNQEFDEPLDVMLYMIIVALGFAAAENLLLVYQRPLLSFQNVLALATIRFVSATFVHALASGIIGYWLAKSIREPQKKFSLLAKGFTLAIFFHAGYNYLVWLIGDKGIGFSSIVPISITFILIGLMSIFVSYNFTLLKKLHSVCKICKTPKSLKP